jgi:hypothetical protein
VNALPSRLRLSRVVHSVRSREQGGTVLSGRLPQLSPSSIRLSTEEVQIAKASGISTTEYARQKLTVEQMKRDGLIRDG